MQPAFKIRIFKNKFKGFISLYRIQFSCILSLNMHLKTMSLSTSLIRILAFFLALFLVTLLKILQKSFMIITFEKRDLGFNMKLNNASLIFLSILSIRFCFIFSIFQFGTLVSKLFFERRNNKLIL